MSEAVLQSPRPARPVRLLSESALAEKAADGDPRAFDEIYRRYHQAIYRYCRSMLGNEHDAMDALQGTMTKAIVSIPGDDREVRLKPWLYRVAHNECIDLIRKRRADADVVDLEPESLSSTEGDAATRDRLRQVLDDIDHLPERQRSALVMRELNGLGFEEIGSALGASASVSRQTVYEARIALQELESGRDMLCEEARHSISVGDGRVMRGRAIKAHLRSCSDCRNFKDGIETRQHQLQSLVPYLPAAAAASILSAIGGGGGAAGLGGGGVLAGGLGAGAKAVAIVAVTATVGAGAIGLHRATEHDGAAGTATPAAGLTAPASSTPVSVGGSGDPDSANRGNRGHRRRTSRSRAGPGHRPAGKESGPASPASANAGSGSGNDGQAAAPAAGEPAPPVDSSAPAVNVPAVKLPKLPEKVTNNLPVDVPKTVEQVQSTVDQVTKQVGGLVPKVPPGGLLGGK